MTKVGKSDREGTFAGTRGNDKVAPIPDLPCLIPERRLSQFVEQRLGLFEVGGVEAFGEPAEDRGEEGRRLLRPALPVAQGERGQPGGVGPAPHQSIRGQGADLLGHNARPSARVARGRVRRRRWGRRRANGRVERSGGAQRAPDLVGRQVAAGDLAGTRNQIVHTNVVDFCVGGARGE